MWRALLWRDSPYLPVLSPAARGLERPDSFSHAFPSLCVQRPQGWQHPAQASAKGPPGSEGPKNQGFGVWPHCPESGVKERYSIKCQLQKGLPELLQRKWTMDGLQKFPLASTENFKLKDGCQHLQSGDFTFRGLPDFC